MTTKSQFLGNFAFLMFCNNNTTVGESYSSFHMKTSSLSISNAATSISDTLKDDSSTGVKVSKGKKIINK